MEKKQLNSGRQFEIDCVKFFALFYMICVHVYEEAGQYDFLHSMPEGVFRNLIEFAGGPLAAPMFMFAMGMGMVYTEHKTYRQFIYRGINLLITGVILNFFRETILELIGNFALGLDFTTDWIIDGLMCIDILAFAGMSFIVVGIMKKFKLNGNIMLVICLVLQAIGIWGMKLNISSAVLRNILGLLLPTGHSVAFPLTLWLIFPVSGQIFGEYLINTDNKASLYKKLILIGVTAVIAVTSWLCFTGNDVRMIYALFEDTYYHQTIISATWTLGVDFIALGLAYYLFKGLEQTKAGRFVTFCGKKLKTIYIIQWLLIAYIVAFLTALEIEKRFSAGEIIFVGCLVEIVAIGITALINKIICKRKNNSIEA